MRASVGVFVVMAVTAFIAVQSWVAHADSGPGTSEAQCSYYQSAAGTIFQHISGVMASLSSQSLSDLQSLMAISGRQLDKKDPSGTSSAMSEQVAAENRLAIVFRNAFVQPDDVAIGPDHAAPVMSNFNRDVYSFCPQGFSVVRYTNAGDAEFAWGYSSCRSDSGSSAQASVIRIQDIWISNDKKPVLTLILTGSDYGIEGAGTLIKKRIDLDLRKLEAQSYSAEDILKMMSPSKALLSSGCSE